MTLDDLKTKVAAQTDVIKSAETLLSGISQKLKDAIAAEDPAVIQAIADSLDANTNELASAVSANTMAE